MLALRLLLCFWALINVCLAFVPDDTVEDSLSECLAYISSRNFYGNIPLVVLSTEPEMKLMKMLHTGRLSLLQNTLEAKAGYVIVIADDFESVARTSSDIFRQSYKNQEALVVWAFKREQADLEKVLGMLFTQYWKFVNIYNVIVLSLDQRKSAFDVYTFFPNEQTHLDKVDKVTVLDTWLIQERRFVRNAYLFPNKEIGFNGTPLKVHLSANAFDFVLFQIVRSIAEYLDARLIFVEREGAFNVFGPVLLQNAFQYHFEILYPFLRDSSFWYVPAGEVRPAFLGLLTIFSDEVWKFVSIALAVGALVLFVLGRFELKTGNSSGCHFLLTALGTSISTRVVTGYRQGASLLFLSMWLLYTMQISTAYKSQLIRAMSQPAYYTEPYIRSMYELFRSNLILTSTISKPEMSEQRILRDWLYRMAYKKDVALLASKSAMDAMINQFRGVTGRPLIVPLHHSEQKLYYSLAVHVGFSVRQRMDAIVSRLHEMGFIDKWQRWFQWNYNSVGSIAGPIVLTLRHFEGPFYLLLIGCLIALVAFVAEHVYNRTLKCVTRAKHVLADEHIQLPILAARSANIFAAILGVKVTNQDAPSG